MMLDSVIARLISDYSNFLLVNFENSSLLDFLLFLLINFRIVVHVRKRQFAGRLGQKRQ